MVASRAQPEGDICAPSNLRVVLGERACIHEDQLSRPAFKRGILGCPRGGGWEVSDEGVVTRTRGSESMTRCSST